MIFVLGIGLLVYVWQLARHMIAWDSISISTNTPETVTSCSVVIAARNEKEHLERLLPQLLQQQFPPKLEILVVDDGSTDSSQNWLAEQDGIRTLHLGENDGVEGKKAAIELGVHSAQNDVIVQTDADCSVNSEWLKHLLGEFGTGVSVVFGPVRYLKKSGFLNGLLDLEMCSLSALCGTGIYLNEPFLGNAANMAYRRSDFLDWQPFRGTKFRSGDDTDIIREALKAGATCAYMKDRQAIVYTEGPKTISQFLHQRLRWASKTGIVQIPFSAAVFFGFNVLLFLGMLVGIMGYPVTNALVFCWIAKWVVDCLFFRKVMRFFNGQEPGLHIYFLVFVLVCIYPVYVSLVSILSKFVPYNWKNRKIRN